MECQLAELPREAVRHGNGIRLHLQRGSLYFFGYSWDCDVAIPEFASRVK
jgi:hypothetical protein